MQFLEKNGMILLPHPPYSPDLLLPVWEELME
uniref:Tc1-like transposase DDE domain-containing protein n=1 Tax=Salarias fasciatus TaxID=181472 RepID=A0A672ILI9_SALFA